VVWSIYQGRSHLLLRNPPVLFTETDKTAHMRTRHLLPALILFLFAGLRSFCAEVHPAHPCAQSSVVHHHRLFVCHRWPGASDCGLHCKTSCAPKKGCVCWGNEGDGAWLWCGAEPCMRRACDVHALDAHSRRCTPDGRVQSRPICWVRCGSCVS
jgi:hypothetical protein